MKENEKEEPPVTEAELARVLELDAKATQGPMHVGYDGPSRPIIISANMDEPMLSIGALSHGHSEPYKKEDADCELFAEYRTLTPRLARELAAARAGEQILWSQLAERDEENAQLRARIAELERELSEHKDEWDRLEMTVEEAHALRAEVERLTKERDKWEETARLYCINSDDWRAKHDTLQRERDEARAALKLKAATLAGIANDLVNARAQLAEREEDRDKAFKNEIAAKCLAEAYKADLEKLNATKPVAVRTNEACICEPGAEWQTDGCPIHPLDDAARAQPEDGK